MTGGSRAAAPTGLLLHVVAPAAMITIASQFFRTSSGVIGRDLAALTPAPSPPPPQAHRW